MSQKILINGAGFAGLTTALATSNAANEIIIIEPLQEEKFTEITEADFRTTALSAYTKSFYKKIGFWENIEDKAGAIEDIKILDSDFTSGDSPLQLLFKSSEISDEPMGYILENTDLKLELYKKVKSKSNIKILFGSKISSFKQNQNNIEFKIENVNTGELSNIKANLALATDGKNSYLRSLCNLKVKEKHYNQTAITFNIKHSKRHNSLAIEKFMPSGPFAVLPMRDQNKSAIVWSVESEIIDSLKKQSENEFKGQVRKRLKDYLGDFEIISEKAYYPLSLKFTKTYFDGRIAFIGDALHGIHPIAGQGFNLGIKDIAEISKLINGQSKLGLDVGSENILQKYQANRLHQNMQMIGATEFFNAIFSNDNKLLTKARRVGISTVNKLKPVKNFFVKKAMGF